MCSERAKPVSRGMNLPSATYRCACVSGNVCPLYVGTTSGAFGEKFNRRTTFPQGSTVLRWVHFVGEFNRTEVAELQRPINLASPSLDV